MQFYVLVLILCIVCLISGVYMPFLIGQNVTDSPIGVAIYQNAGCEENSLRL